MRTFDLTPFYRSTVGFDRLFSLLDQSASESSPGYPPYNIDRTKGPGWINLIIECSSSIRLHPFKKRDQHLVAEERAWRRYRRDAQLHGLLGICADAARSGEKAGNDKQSSDCPKQ